MAVALVLACSASPTPTAEPVTTPVGGAGSKSEEAPSRVDIVAIFERIRVASEGDVIVVPAGTYDVDVLGGLLIENKRGITLVADGEVALISKKTDGEIVIVRNSHEVTIEGFQVRHRTETECTAACITIEGSDSVTIRGNDIHGSGAYGVALWGGNNRNIRILNNEIHDCSYWAIEFHSVGGEISGNELYDNADAIDMGSSTDVVVRDNRIRERDPES